MNDVLVPEAIPDRTAKLSLLLKRHPIESCQTVEDLISCIQSVMTTYNRAAIYTCYFIGRAFNATLLSKKYPGLTVEKLAAALNLGRSTAYRYKRLSEILTPEEVDSLGHIPYFQLMELPKLEQRFGPAAVKELKFRLQTNDFEGARGSSAFDQAVAEMAEQRLMLGAAMPGATVPGSSSEDDEDVEKLDNADPKLLEASAEAINNDGEEEEDSDDPVAKLLAERKKQAAGGGSDLKGRIPKSELRQNAEIAFSQARGALVKLRNMYTRIRDDSDALLDKVWDQEAYIIGDPDVDAKYREFLGEVAAQQQRVLETLLKLQKAYRLHGQCLGKVEVPDGATPTSLLGIED